MRIALFFIHIRRAEILRKFVKRWKNMIHASAGTCILSKIAIPFLQGQQLRCICSNFRPHDGVISDQWCHTERKYFQFSIYISQLLLYNSVVRYRGIFNMEIKTESICLFIHNKVGFRSKLKPKKHITIMIWLLLSI